MLERIRNDYHYTVYACWITEFYQAVINNFAPLLFLIFNTEFDISISKITLLVTVNFAVQLTVDFFGGKLTDLFGTRACFIGGHLLTGVGFLGLAFFPGLFPDPLVGLLLAVTLYGIGGGFNEVLTSATVEACPTKNKERNMSILHSFFCWGSVACVLISTLFLHFFGKENWRTLACIWAAFPIVESGLYAIVPIYTLTEKGNDMGFGRIFKMPVFWLFAALMFAAGASELCMSQWASSFAEKGLGVSKTVGDIAGPCFFAVLMGIARIIHAKVSDRLDLKKALVFCGILCLFSYLLCVFSPIPALSLLGCGICGFSVGIMWPGVISLASARIPAGGTGLFGLMAFAGDVGCSLGPTVVGEIAGAFQDDLRYGLLAAALFPAILAVLTLFLKKRVQRGA